MTIFRAMVPQIILPASKQCEQPLSLNCAHFVGKPPVMTESEFTVLIEQTFLELETALDEVEADIDCETSGGVLTVVFENGTRLVFSRQPPTRQLWLAAKSGGFHYDFDEEAGDWRDTRAGYLLRPCVVEHMQAQGGVHFAWL
jgi:CyaY protein